MITIKINFWFYLLVLLFLAGLVALLVDVLACFVFLKKGRRTAYRVLKEKPIKEFYQEKKALPNYCCYEDISDNLKVILVNLEDKTFWKHHGFNLIKTVQALLANMIKWEKGRGGSTITQQLAKNMYFSFEKTFHRKIAEAFVAYELERTLTKEQILELYLNIVYFGEKMIGIGEACQYYFEKAPADLTVNQAVALCCVIPGPVRYNPVNPESAFLKGKRNALNVLCRRNLFEPKDIDAFMQAGNCVDFNCDISRKYEEMYQKLSKR